MNEYKNQLPYFIDIIPIYNNRRYKLYSLFISHSSNFTSIMSESEYQLHYFNDLFPINNDRRY